jgi:membrane protein implicated in regulation of membrane protease activity
MFFFGAGAMLTALAAAVLPPLAGSLPAQVLLWAASSVLSFVFLRRRFAKIFRGTVLNRISDEGLGEMVEVLEAITPEKPGRVRYRGSSWKAVSLTESFSTGDRAEVVESSGLTLTVTAPFDEDHSGDEFLERLEQAKEEREKDLN